MTLLIKHSKVLSKSDGVDVTVVQPSDWNAALVATAASGKVLGTVVGSTTVGELPIAVDGSGNATFSGDITTTGGDLTVTGASVNANVFVTSTGGSGRSWSIVSNNSTGGLSIVDVTGSATRVFVSSAGLVGIGTTAPSDPLTVNGVIKSTTGGFGYPDGTTQTTAAATPTGALVAFAGAAAPTGWLLCAGQEVSRATYAALFAVVGTTYGPGNGSTTFNVPDLRGRVAAGKDDMNGTAATRMSATTMSPNATTLGASGGTETHVLTAAQLPAHQHLILGDIQSGTNPSASNYVAKSANYSSNNNYDLGASATVATLGLTSSVGSGTAHSNTQPTIVLNYIIKT